MTAPALAELAIRFDCPIIPLRIERLQGSYFRVTFSPPIQISNSKGKSENILQIMTDVNQKLAEWIIEKPEQWLWLHNRWPN